MRVLEGHSGSVRSVAFGPDGKTALSGSDDKIAQLWNLDTGAGSARSKVTPPAS
jgi:WD40 repeat protein